MKVPFLQGKAIYHPLTQLKNNLLPHHWVEKWKYNTYVAHRLCYVNFAFSIFVRVIRQNDIILLAQRTIKCFGLRGSWLHFEEGIYTPKNDVCFSAVQVTFLNQCCAERSFRSTIGGYAKLCLFVTETGCRTQAEFSDFETTTLQKGTIRPPDRIRNLDRAEADYISLLQEMRFDFPISNAISCLFR